MKMHSIALRFLGTDSWAQMKSAPGLTAFLCIQKSHVQFSHSEIRTLLLSPYRIRTATLQILGLNLVPF